MVGDRRSPCLTPREKVGNRTVVNNTVLTQPTNSGPKLKDSKPSEIN